MARLKLLLLLVKGVVRLEAASEDIDQFSHLDVG